MEKEISDYILENDCENFKKNVLSVFCKLESKKSDLLKKYRKKSLWFFIAFAIFAVLAIFSSLNLFTQILPYFSYDIKLKIFILFMILIAALIITAFLFFDMRRKTNREFNSILKRKALKQLFQDGNNIKWTENDPSKNCYNINKTIKEEELKKSGLFLPYNKRYIDDEFKGMYSGVPFTISETILYEEVRGRKSRTCTKIFQGIIMSFDFNKTIKNRTIVSTKGDFILYDYKLFLSLFIFSALCGPGAFEKGGHNMFIYIGMVILFLFLCFVKENKDLKKINLEDPKFIKRFNVYSSDQVEARYLVTPSFMEHFYNLNTTFGTKKIKCSFYDNKLMIAICTNKNLFEIGSIFKPLDNPKLIENFYNELSSIYKMIDYFKLNENIYLK